MSARAVRLWWVGVAIGFIEVSAGFVLTSYDVATSIASGLMFGGAWTLWYGGYLQGLHKGLQALKSDETVRASQSLSGQDSTK